MGRATGGATLVERPPQELDDHALVSEVRDGDDAAFEALYERYRRRITAYVKGMVYDHGRAEDVTQDVFMSALRRMRETERPIAFKPWIYEIARNACIDHHRRNRRGEEVSYDAEHGLGSSDHRRLVTTEPTPDAALDTKQQIDHLCGAFGGLSGSHHQILVLRELEGLSYREIGERMSLSRPAVESTLFRARRRLTEEYEDLESGRRCERVQTIIASAAEGLLGARDRRRLARHVSHCEGCRHHARRMGVSDVRPARGVGARLAALLPLPSFLRSTKGSRPDTAGDLPTHASSSLSQWAVAASPAGESVATSWAKAAATVATMAALGMGANVSSHSGAISLVAPQVRSHSGEATMRTPDRRLPASAGRPGDAGAALQGATASGPVIRVTSSRPQHDHGRTPPRAPYRPLPARVSPTPSVPLSQADVALPAASEPLRSAVRALPAREQGRAPSVEAGVPGKIDTPPPPLGTNDANVSDIGAGASGVANPVTSSATEAGARPFARGVSLSGASAAVAPATAR